MLFASSAAVYGEPERVPDLVAHHAREAPERSGHARIPLRRELDRADAEHGNGADRRVEQRVVDHARDQPPRGAELPRLVSDARELIQNLTRLTAADSSLALSLANVQNITESATPKTAQASV